MLQNTWLLACNVSQVDNIMFSVEIVPTLKAIKSLWKQSYDNISYEIFETRQRLVS